MTTSTDPISLELQSKLEFILYYKKDSPDREFNVKTAIHYLFSTFPKAQIVVIHDGPEADPDFVTYIRNCPLSVKASFVENTGEFRKSRAFNIGADMIATRDILCFWDVDVLIRSDFVLEACRKIDAGEADHVYPFNGTFVDVQRDLFQDFITRFNFHHIEKLWDVQHPSLHFASGESPGGCTMISRSAFERMGKYDERFIGWGFEDTDFLYRSRKVNRVEYLSDVKAICWHLHHENAKRVENPHYNDNLRIFNYNAAC